MKLSAIGETSPLYAYWNSHQDSNDELERLLKMRDNSKSSYLFENEPYKWENLYQSIVKEIMQGDIGALRGLKVLLSMLKEEEVNNTLCRLKEKQILNEITLSELEGIVLSTGSTSKNKLRFLRILFAIFTNPYGIELKGNRHHLYEHTGYYFNQIRKIISF